MKINKFIGLLACTMAFTACQNDMLEADVQQSKIYTLSGKMSAGKVMSRAQIELGSSNSAEEIAFWNEGDQFLLFQNIAGSLNSSVFTISGEYNELGENRQSATFTTDTPAQSGRYIAIYPGGVRREGNSVKMEFQTELDFTNASTSEVQANIWQTYMMNNMFMIADGTLTGEGVNAVTFRHLCALARVTYTNETGEKQTINEVNLGGDQSFSFAWSYNVEGGYQDGGSSTNGYTLRTHGLTVEPGASTDLYMFFFPHEFNLGGEMHLNLSTNLGRKGVTLPVTAIQNANGGAAGFEAGKRYWFKVTEYKNGMVWTKDYSTETVTFENKELSLALLNYLGESMVTLNEEGSAVMNAMDVKSVQELHFSGNITRLDGIEKFVNLKRFNLTSSEVEHCHLNMNSNLEEVTIQFNNLLRTVNLGSNPELLRVRCSFNDKLNSLEISDSRNLIVLDVENTALESLTIPNASILETLYYGNTKITPFDLTGFDNLKVLDMDNMNLDNLDLIPDDIKKQLEILFVDDNNLTELVLTQFPKLGDLHCNRNNIKELNLQATPELVSLSCTENLIETLNVSHLVGMYTLNCGKQQNDIVLNLSLNSNQKTEWDNNWGKSSENTNVTLNVVSDGNAGGE